MIYVIKIKNKYKLELRYVNILNFYRQEVFILSNFKLIFMVKSSTNLI
jgi:hypothetical protein